MSKEKNWKEIALAGVSSKSSVDFKTGDWKTYMPIRDPQKCTKCLLCVMHCPEGAIRCHQEGEKLEFDLTYCKGCGICANQCATQAITMKLPQGGQ